jgi:twitching motility protein PilT
MLRLDFYVQHLVRHNARGIELTSGQPVRFHFEQGARQSNKALAHAQLAQVLKEAAPQQALQELSQTGRCSFRHASSAGMDVQVEVEAQSAQQWRVMLQPAGGAGDPASEGPRADAAPAQPAAQPEAASREAEAAASEDFTASRTAARRTSQPPKPPQVSVSSDEPQINRYLRAMVQMGASDLHLSSGVPPMIRLHGEMQPLEGQTIDAEELEKLVLEIAPERNRKEFEERRDTDFSHMIEDVARFRVNAFEDRKGVGAVFRQIPFEILPPEKLGLPKQVLDLCYLTKGLVLVTGPTGSGKSTTLATLIDYINENRKDHIITIEDPIEFVHGNKQCLVNQREVGTHTLSFKNALRAALREDPDIVLVGEMRDLETISIAIETAETGHLVFGTLHTTSAISTVDRIIDQFPADQQAQIRVMLSESLRGVIAQVLCRRKGGGRAAGYEVLVSTSAVSNLIREGKTFQLQSVMQTGKNLGMQTMNEHLIQHVKNGVIDAEEAYIKSNDKQTMRQLLQREGVELQLES